MVDQTSSRMSKDLPEMREETKESYTIHDEEKFYDANEEDIESDASVSNKVFGWRSGLKNHNKSVESLCLEILDLHRHF